MTGDVTGAPWIGAEASVSDAERTARGSSGGNPPYRNTGGKVSDGRTKLVRDMHESWRVRPDYVAVSFAGEAVKPAEHWRMVLQAATGLECVQGDTGGGGLGWEHKVLYRISGAVVGWYLWGGESQRGVTRLEITGTGCGLVRQWATIYGACWHKTAYLTRCDLCADDFNGSYDVDAAIWMWEQGRFGSGGRKPSARLVDDMGSGKGRTFYVGARASGKMLRVYEKGRQLGDKGSRWVRWEMEFLRGKSQTLPWAMLTDPEAYFAGAYPALQVIIGKAGTRIEVERKTTDTTMAVQVSWARRSYGGLVWMLLMHGLSPDRVVTLLARRSQNTERRIYGRARAVGDEAWAVLAPVWQAAVRADTQARLERAGLWIDRSLPGRSVAAHGGPRPGQAERSVA